MKLPFGLGRVRPLRIGFARIFQETNSFSPLETTLEDFKAFHYLDGDALLKAVAPRNEEFTGFLKEAELSGFAKAARRDGAVEMVPLLSAATPPSGPVDGPTLDALLAALIARVERAGELDGVYIALHGAMRSSGEHPDADAHILGRLREAVGPDVPVAVSFDLHVNLTPRKLESADIVTLYRTNPHRDFVKVGARTAQLLFDAARGRIAPTSAWRSLPMVLGGGYTMDFLAPMRGIFLKMKALELHPRVLYVSLAMAHIWSDAPDLGWAVHVVTDGDEALAERLAERLAEDVWAVRHAMPPTMETPASAFEKAKGAWWARKLGVISMPDISDIVGAGGVGENTNILSHLLETPPGLKTFLPMRAPTAIEHIWGAGVAVGDKVTVEVGGDLDPKHNPNLTVTGALTRRRDTTTFGRTAVLDLGDVQLILTEKAPITMQPRFFEDVGLEVRDADVIIQKSIFHYRFFFGPRTLRHIPIATSGTTSLECYKKVTFDTPVHPLDDVVDWRSLDRRRRGAPARA